MKIEKIELTNREVEMLKNLAEGISYNEIVQQFSIAKDTVYKHFVQAYKKLQARNGVHAVVLALRSKIIS